MQVIIMIIISFLGLRGTFMQHCYDFYKPDMSSEYPIVDGKLSIKCYFTALDKCYQLYKDRFSKKFKSSQPLTTVEDFDYVLFHTPFCKIVQKSFGRLVLSDFLALKEKLSDIAILQEKYKDLLSFK